MKKLFTLITVLFITAPAYAQETINVNVNKVKSFDEQQNEKKSAAAAATTAAAALSAARSESSTKIKIPLNVNLNNYTKIAIVGAETMGWNPDYGKYGRNFKSIGNHPRRRG